MDNLNLLYVAFTRPEDNLFVMGNMPVPNKEKVIPFKKVNDLIFRVLSGKFTEEEDKITYTNGVMITKASESATKTVEMALSSFVSTSWTKKIRLRSQANSYFLSSNSNKSNAVKLGILVHELLSKIKKSTDLENELNRLSMMESLSEEERLQVKEQVFLIIENPDVKAYFSNEWEIKAESSFIDKKGELIRPDRVLIKDGNATVMEFKTGAPEDKHEKQVRKYMEGVKMLGYKNAEGILIYSNGIIQKF
jgi:hypothetical protein